MLWSRVVRQLRIAEARETDPWLRDDIKIARLTVAYAGLGEAVCCSPHVLASYEVLGLHPEKVWPAIQERRKALGPIDVIGAPPKKPAQSVTLWPKKMNGARAVNSRPAVTVLREPAISVPTTMAAPSIAALYPNSDAPSSGKTPRFTYSQWIRIVKFSHARDSVRRATLNALSARGPWPDEDGPAHGIVCVSLAGMQLGNEDGDGRNVVRRTAQRRAKLACELGFWKKTHSINRWLNCPKCSAERTAAKCESCGHRGRSLNADGSTNMKEFCRPFTYLIDIQKFLTAEPPKGLRHMNWRTYREYKEAAKRGEHPNVTEFPRKPSQQTESLAAVPSAPATSKPVAEKPGAETHRETGRSLTPRQRKELARRIDLYAKGCTQIPFANGSARQLQPGDREYIKPMDRIAAVLAACQSMCRGDDARSLEAHGCAMDRARQAAQEMGEGP